MSAPKQPTAKYTTRDRSIRELTLLISLRDYFKPEIVESAIDQLIRLNHLGTEAFLNTTRIMLPNYRWTNQSAGLDGEA